MIDIRLVGEKSGLMAAFFLLRRASMLNAVVVLLMTACFAGSFLVSNHYPPWMNAYNDALATGAIVLLLALVARHKNRLVIPAPARFVAVVAAIPLVQFAFGQITFFGDAWIAALYVLGLALAIVAGANAATLWRRQVVTSMCVVWLVVALISCLLVLVQRFSIDVGSLGLFIWDVKTGHAPFGNLGQPNQMSTFFVLALVALGYLHEISLVRPVWTLSAATLFVLCIAMTQSRAALLMLVLAAAFVLFFRTRVKLRTSAYAVGYLIVLWVVAFFLLPRLGEIIGLSDTASVASRLDAGPRTIIWKQLVEAALRSPWFGYGWNQVSVAQMQVAADFEVSRFTEHSHNIFLELVLWNGFPIAMLISTVGLWWVAGSVRAMRTTEATFSFLFIATLLTHSLVEFPLDYLYFLLPFGFAVGLLDEDRRITPASVLMPKWASRALPAVVGLILILVTLDYAHFEEKYRDLRLTLARVGVPLVSKGDGPIRTEFTQLSALAEFSRIEVVPEMSSVQLEWMEKVANRQPYVPVLYRYALARALNGDMKSAEAAFVKMRRLHTEKNYLDAKSQFTELAAGLYPQLRAVQFPK